MFVSVCLKYLCSPFSGRLHYLPVVSGSHCDSNTGLLEMDNTIKILIYLVNIHKQNMSTKLYCFLLI